ncbi:hypothetical protein HXX76_012953 [Chlamydomonas incerta]|uniref:Uncharacterized protein n=1 Tax=Chlamydomonas incerta TaxID=51695 RepID=A0A835SGN3_CHLIN|nr:hypothetical protein HXX76_012953 [Chlamydomonas incerta]|eukprot:KAG2426639.1 hypothetical protein HXX76_012953 [Chlamydomonas incerta]
MPAPGGTVTVRRLECCPADSSDRGSCRVRLPASCGLPYHKPVIITLNSPDGSEEQPWRLLCITAIASDETVDANDSSSSSSSRSSSGASSVHVVDRAVVDPTVVLPPPGRQPAEVQAALAAAAAMVAQQAAAVVAALPGGAQALAMAVVAPCPGTNTVPVASEVQLRFVGPPPATPASGAGSLQAAVWDAQSALSERLSFKLHQALVLPGCYVRLSDAMAVEVVGLSPAPQAPDCPARIVPSTRLVFTNGGASGGASGAGQGTDAAAHAASAFGCGGSSAEDSEQTTPAGRTGGGGGAAAAAAAGGSTKKGTKGKVAKEEGSISAGRSKATGSSREGAVAAADKTSAEGSACVAGGEANAAAEAGVEQDADVAVADGKSTAVKLKKKKKEASGSKAKSGIRATASAFEALLGLEDD